MNSLQDVVIIEYRDGFDRMVASPYRSQRPEENHVRRCLSLVFLWPFFFDKVRIKMASVQKFTISEVPSQICHVERTSESDNIDIDASRLVDDYILSPDRGMDSYDYFNDRISHMHYLHRKDVIMLIGWVVTAPIELPKEQQKLFFAEVYSFFSTKYQEKNIVSAAVHADEKGRPHEHILIIPAVKDDDITHSETERILCKQLINRKELRSIHNELQRFLDDCGICVSIRTGITRRLGGNLSIDQLKQRGNRFYFSRG